MADLFDFLNQAVAAGFGAWAAFQLEARRQQRKLASEHAAAIREGLFALISYRNYLIHLNRRTLVPHIEHPQRHLTVPFVAIPFPYRPVRLEALGFLLGTEDAKILSDLDEAELQFQTVVGVLAARNNLHLELQSRLEGAQPGKKEGTLDDIDAAAGPFLVAHLKGVTDSLYDMADAATRSVLTAYNSLEDLLRDKYPTERVPKLIRPGSGAVAG